MTLSSQFETANNHLEKAHQILNKLVDELQEKNLLDAEMLAYLRLTKDNLLTHAEVVEKYRAACSNWEQSQQ